MKKLNKLSTAIALSLTLAMVTPMAMPANYSIISQAATINLNKKTATVAPGKTVQLNLTGTKAKTTWTSSEKTVATVDKDGKVTAKKAGKATITATASGEKYTCVVTVKSSSSVKTPYKSKKATFKGYEYLVPSAWKSEKSTGSVEYYPSNKSEETTLGLFIETVGMQIGYDSLKELYVKQLKEEFKDFGVTTEPKATKLDSKLGTAMKVELTIEQDGQKVGVVCYVISTNKDIIQILTMDANAKANPSAKSVGEYIFKSIKK